MNRTWLDEEEGAIRFPDTKSGAQTRVIGQAAIELLLVSRKRSRPSFSPPTGATGISSAWFGSLIAICETARLADITPHTLRHTFASLAGDLGFSELTIAALLGHSARGVTQRYIHIDEALRMTADRVAGEMADILDGRATIARPRRRGAHQSQESPEAAQHAAAGRALIAPLARGLERVDRLHATTVKAAASDAVTARLPAR